MSVELGEAFPRRVREKLSTDFFPGLSTMLSMIDQLTVEIRSMDREVERACKANYPEAQRLRQIAGVGPITSLCFVLTIDNPHRFKKSRSIGAFLGLRPRQRDSGMQRPKLSITKAGDRLLRRLLVSASQYILGPFGLDTDLRRFGLRLAAAGGAAKTRAVVAVARKLSVLMHRLWVTGEDYEPLRQATAVGAA